MRLADVLGVVVQQSPSLASAQINQKIAEAQVVQATGIDDMLLQATGSYVFDANQNVDGNITGVDESRVAAATATLSKLMSSGGTLSLQANTSRRAFTLTFDGSEVVTDQAQVSARFAQPLLRGRGNEISHASQRQARNNLSAVALDLQATARDEIRAVIEAYWEVVWAHNDLEIRRSALALAVERRRLTESSVKLGSAPRTALLEVDQVMATNEEEILLAQQRVTERSLDLRRLAGLEIGPSHIDVTTAEQLSVAPKPFTVGPVLDAAFATSPELGALEKRGKSATIEIAVADNSAAARLDLGLSAGPQGTDDNFGGAVGRMVTFKGYFVGADLTYEQRLGNNTAKGASQVAQARRHLLRVNERQMRAQLAVSATRAVQSANIANKRMELSQRAIGLSEQNIEAERRRFESGKATNFDVLQRQEEQKQARLRYARAEVDYLRATIAIQALRGELLSSYGITL
jgi:outer membrane protein TolC